MDLELALFISDFVGEWNAISSPQRICFNRVSNERNEKRPVRTHNFAMSDQLGRGETNSAPSIILLKLLSTLI